MDYQPKAQRRSESLFSNATLQVTAAIVFENQSPYINDETLDVIVDALSLVPEVCLGDVEADDSGMKASCTAEQFPVGSGGSTEGSECDVSCDPGPCHACVLRERAFALLYAGMPELQVLGWCARGYIG